MGNFAAIKSSIGRAISLIWADLWTSIFVNGLWLFANLLIIPGPPATLALSAFCNGVASGEPYDQNDYWALIKAKWKLGWTWGIVQLIVLLFLAGDLYITNQAPDFLGKRFLMGTYLALALLWLTVQFFALPFLHEQREESLKQAWSNSLVLIARNPLFTLILMITLGLILLIGIPLFGLSLFFGAIFTSLLANLAVKDRIARLKRLETNRPGQETDHAT